MGCELEVPNDMGREGLRFRLATTRITRALIPHLLHQRDTSYY